MRCRLSAYRRRGRIGESSRETCSLAVGNVTGYEDGKGRLLIMSQLTAREGLSSVERGGIGICSTWMDNDCEDATRVIVISLG